MKQLIIFWLLLGVSVYTHAQTITIFNYITREPLENTSLESKSPSVFRTTDIKGRADISDFKGSDSIFFNHLGFKEVVYSYAQLKAMNFSVELKEEYLSLREVVISSNRWEQKKVETPSRIEVINMKEASFQNPQTAADLLGISGYAFIQKSQLGGGSPMLRGMATNRVLLVVDGVRMNTAIFRSGNLQNVISLDANAMESTEILLARARLFMAAMLWVEL